MLNIKKLDDGNYSIRDSVENKFYCISSWDYYESLWDLDMNFIRINLNQKQFDLNNKTSDDYRKVVMAKNRHLKALKKHLGMGVEVKKQPVAIISRSDVGKTTINIVQVEEKNETLVDERYIYKKTHVLFTKDIDQELIDQYNNEFQQWKKRSNELLTEIFKL